MRRFELVLVFTAAFAVGWPVVFGVRPRRGIVALLLAAALFVQLQFEGFRWQMIPLYLAAASLAFGDLIYVERRLDWSGRLLRLLLGVVGLLLALALPTVLPVPELPTPSGPEAIGTFSVDVIDASRDELWGPPPAGGPREFVAQVWYPASGVGDGERVPWSEDWEVVAPGISRQLGLPSWFLDHTRYSLSHTEVEAPLASGTYPVIIYSHDWGGVRANTLNQIEHLVSNGYIVIAPDHTYGSVATVFEDGDVAEFDPTGLPDPATVTEEEYDESATAIVATFAADLVTILTELEEGATGVFAQIAAATDLNRVGVYGHGAGGGAAIKVCLEAEQCSAVLAMDPWVEPLTQRDLQQEMVRPALYMRSEDWVGTANDALLSGIAARGEAVTYTVGIEGAWHNDFLLTPLLSPFTPQFGLRGPIPAGRIILINNNYLRGFFDVFLLGTGSAALDSVTFEEVDVSVFDPQE